jgi:hypothetical protein
MARPPTERTISRFPRSLSRIPVMAPFVPTVIREDGFCNTLPEAEIAAGTNAMAVGAERAERAKRTRRLALGKAEVMARSAQKEIMGMLTI